MGLTDAMPAEDLALSGEQFRRVLPLDQERQAFEAAERWMGTPESRWCTGAWNSCASRR